MKPPNDFFHVSPWAASRPWGFLKLHKRLIKNLSGIVVDDVRPSWNVNGQSIFTANAKMHLEIATPLGRLTSKTIPPSLGLDYDEALKSPEVEHILLEEKHGWVLQETHARLLSHLNLSQRNFHLQPQQRQPIPLRYLPSQHQPLSPLQEKLIQFQPETTLNTEAELARYLFMLHPEIMGLNMNRYNVQLFLQPPTQLSAPLIAFRGWHLGGSGKITSTGVNGAWEPNQGPVWKARCNHYSNSFGAQREVPAINCGCGIHAFYTLERCLEYHLGSDFSSGLPYSSRSTVLLGAVMLTGTFIRYEDGVRAEKARIVAFADDGKPSPEWELIARTYKAPLIHIDHLVDYAKEFGMLLEPLPKNEPPSNVINWMRVQKMIEHENIYFNSIFGKEMMNKWLKSNWTT